MGLKIRFGGIALLIFWHYSLTQWTGCLNGMSSVESVKRSTTTKGMLAMIVSLQLTMFRAPLAVVMDQSVLQFPKLRFFGYSNISIYLGNHFFCGLHKERGSNQGL